MASGGCHGWSGTSKWIGLVLFLWVEMVVYTIQNGICGVNSWVVCWGNSIGEWLANGLILAGNEGHMKYRTTVFLLGSQECSCVWITEFVYR